MLLPTLSRPESTKHIENTGFATLKLSETIISDLHQGTSSESKEESLVVGFRVFGLIQS